MSVWTLLMIAALMGAFLAYCLGRAQQSHDLIYKQRLRHSELFAQIYPLIERAKASDLERVQIERTRVSFYSVYPPGIIGEFSLTDTSWSPMDERKLWAMTQAIADDLPILLENKCYRLSHMRVQRPNGIWDSMYHYDINMGYKTELIKACQRRRRIY